MAANVGLADSVRVLVQGNSNEIDKPDKLRQTALHHCVLGSFADKVRILLGASADVTCVDLSGWRVLHFAAPKADREVIQLLLDAKAGHLE